MPICNPIKRSAALLQSRYDSLLPRGTDRESGATQVCLCLVEGVCMGGNTAKHSRRDRCVSATVLVSLSLIHLSRTQTGSPQTSESRSAGSLVHGWAAGLT